MGQRDFICFDFTVGNRTPGPYPWDARTLAPRYCPGADRVTQELNSRISTVGKKSGQEQSSRTEVLVTLAGDKTRKQLPQQQTVGRRCFEQLWQVSSGE